MTKVVLVQLMTHKGSFYKKSEKVGSFINYEVEVPTSSSIKEVLKKISSDLDDISPGKGGFYQGDLEYHLRKVKLALSSVGRAKSGYYKNTPIMSFKVKVNG